MKWIYPERQQTDQKFCVRGGVKFCFNSTQPLISGSSSTCWFLTTPDCSQRHSNKVLMELSCSYLGKCELFFTPCRFFSPFSWQSLYTDRKKKKSNVDPIQLLRKLMKAFLMDGEPLTALNAICIYLYKYNCSRSSNTRQKSSWWAAFEITSCSMFSIATFYSIIES